MIPIKNIFYKTLAIILLFGLCYLPSCNSDYDNINQNLYQLIAPTHYISELNLGESTQERVVQGTVITSDSCNNFYQSIIIEDPTGSIELRFSFYNLYSMYKRGDVVSVVLDGLRVDAENGLMYAYIGSLTTAKKRVFNQGYQDHIYPVNLAIDKIADEHIGKLVKISNVRFKNEGDGTWSGSQRIYSQHGTIDVYTSAYANFANRELPVGEVTLIAIVAEYNNKLQLKISCLDSDCITD